MIKINEGIDISGITDPNLMAAAINIQKQADSAKASYDNKINALANQVAALKSKQQQINSQKANAKENSQNNSAQTNESEEVNIDDNEKENKENYSEIEPNILFILFEYKDNTYVYKYYNNGKMWVSRSILNEIPILEKIVFGANKTKEEILDYLSKIFGHIKELNDKEIDNILDTI